jgi:hypothetical protein
VEDPTAHEPAAAGADLSQEFERIDVEKERLRRLAAHLGFEAAPPDEPPAEPVRAEAAAPPPDPLGAAPPPQRPVEERGPAPRPRPSIPLGDSAVQPPGAPHAAGGAARRPPSRERRELGAGARSAPLLEALSGFVPAALYDEMKRERDELFFRLARLESERSQVQQVRRALDIMEAEIRRLEAEIRRRQTAVAPAAGLEELRRAYRRWLDLRRRRPLRFGDFLAVRQTEADPP